MFNTAAAGAPAIVRHRSSDRISLKLERDLRTALAQEATKGDGAPVPEAVLIRQLVVDGLLARGHQLETRRRGRRAVVRLLADNDQLPVAV